MNFVCEVKLILHVFIVRKDFKRRHNVKIYIGID